jgi:folate-binding protein YgfZ
MPNPALVAALAAGEAFADLSGWRKIGVSGGDAKRWLNDLISADIAGLEPGHARRSLLLTPTGRIRAEFTVVVDGGGLLLLQDPAQLASIGDLLGPYVLSSDVELRDRSDELALFALPARLHPPDVDGLPGARFSVPSVVGSGLDLVAPAGDHDAVLDSLSTMFALAGADDLDAWRVIAGIPRFGVDALADDLPQEAGLTDAVSFDKGCYLGQEAVAKVRNLGHPRRVVLRLSASGAVSAGEGLEADGRAVGEITGAVVMDGRWWALARVEWDARGVPLRSAGGVPLGTPERA